MRLLAVHDTEFEIDVKTAEALIAEGILYECGDTHDLHLTPDHEWNSLSVEKVLLAIAGDIK